MTLDPDRHREWAAADGEPAAFFHLPGARSSSRIRFADAPRLKPGLRDYEARCHYHGNFVIGNPGYRNHGSARQPDGSVAAEVVGAISGRKSEPKGSSSSAAPRGSA